MRDLLPIVAASLALAGCNLGYTGLYLSSCDGGSFPGANCPAAGSSGGSGSTGAPATGSSGGATSGVTSGATGGTSGGPTGTTNGSTAATSTTGGNSTAGGSTGSSGTTTSGSSGGGGTTGSTSGGSTGGACGNLTGTLTVDVAYDFFTPDTQGLVAVAGGTPYLQMSAASPTYWNLERAKSWYTISNHIASEPGTEQLFSQCLPPGEYTVQLWNIACGPSDPGCAGTNNGTPPNVTYLWTIGDPSRPITLTAGGAVGLRVEDTETNTPSYDNYYTTYGLWSYGSCASGAACPSGTTCYQDVCYDTGYDIRNCGAGGVACTAESCCDGICTDPSADASNCGGCGVVCSVGTVCQSGQCQPANTGCGLLTAEVGDQEASGTGYQGVSAIAGGLPYQPFALDDERLWPAEQAKVWTTFDRDIESLPFVQTFYSICVPPGDYTVQYWNIGCINNLSGCGTFDDGTPPNTMYVWQIGDASRSLPVSVGSTTPVSVENTETNVPMLDNFYGSYSLWSYGGCPDGQSDCPSGTSCVQGVCTDLGYDIRNCGSAGVQCVAEDCCPTGCADLSSDPNNCGGCGLVCTGATTCSAGYCH